MAVQIPYYSWGGGAAAGVAGDYLDIKTKPVSSRVTNSELLAAGALALDAFGVYRDARTPQQVNYRNAVHGAAGWAAGVLAAGIARRHLLPTVATTPTTPKTTAPTSTASASNTAGGVSGVPASSGSAAFDLPAGGY
jgi:hypothetical protein